MMKLLFSAAVLFIGMSFTTWQPNFEKAKQIAKSKHQLILLNFSGSDWCGPCMRMKSEFFNDSVFSKMADTSLVLVNADFPRNKKNKLTAEVQKQNNTLADKYDPDGKFPFTLLMDENGKIIKTWDGLPDMNADVYTKQIVTLYNANKKQ